MKRPILLLMILLLCSTGIIAQSVPRSPHVEDQKLQGPCYIFALTAALESKAMQDPSITLTDPNFDEWYFYSAPVLTYDGSIMPVWSGHLMIPAALKFMKDFGIKEGLQHDLDSIDLPNKNRLIDNNQLPGVAEFESSCYVNSATAWANIQSYDHLGTGAYLQKCRDMENLDDYIFENRDSSLPTYRLEGAPDDSNTLFIRDNDPTAAKIGNLLQDGHGVIAFFQNWNGTGREHAIFIFSKLGNTYGYKDSWHNAQGIKFTTLPIENCVSIYHLPGKVFNLANQPANCQYKIVGTSDVSGVTSYSIAGGSNVSWAVSGDFVFDGPSIGRNVKIASTRCSGTSSGTISVSYKIGSTTCSDVKNLTSYGFGSAKPSSIQINGPSGLDTACPGSVIQLQAIDNINPSTTTTYNWSISGASILNGQSTKVVNIQIWNGSSIYQSYKVRAKKGSCSYSSWRTLIGYVTQQGCDGGGGGIFGPDLMISRRMIDASRYFIQNSEAESIVIDVYSLAGKRIFTSTLSRNSMQTTIPVSSSDGVWIVNVTDQQSRKVGRFKISRLHE